MLNTVHLFDPDRGSRYPLMISHGLAALSASFSTNVSHISFGVRVSANTLGNDVGPIMAAIEGADYVFRPSNEHFFLPGHPIRELWGNTPNLWGKTVYCDFSDSNELDSAGASALVYTKRTTPKSLELPDNFMRLHLSGMLEYDLQSPSLLEDGDGIEALYAFHPAIMNGNNPNEEGRRKMFAAIHDHPSVLTGQTSRTGRRDILRSNYLPDEDGNPGYRELLVYLARLRLSKLIVTILPEHGGADNRIWEALQSGTPTMCDVSASDMDPDLRAGVHYIPIDPHADKKEIISKLEYWLSDSMAKERARIGAAARRHVITKCLPEHRVRSVLDFALNRKVHG